jgi:hypothetical protein
MHSVHPNAADIDKGSWVFGGALSDAQVPDRFRKGHTTFATRIPSVPDSIDGSIRNLRSLLQILRPVAPVKPMLVQDSSYYTGH